MEGLYARDDMYLGGHVTCIIVQICKLATIIRVAGGFTIAGDQDQCFVAGWFIYDPSEWLPAHARESPAIG